MTKEKAPFGEFKPFYFESHEVHGWIRYPSDFEELRKIHELGYLSKARSWDRDFHLTGSIRPFYGFIDQCRKGKTTLLDYFEKFGMMEWWI